MRRNPLDAVTEGEVIRMVALDAVPVTELPLDVELDFAVAPGGQHFVQQAASGVGSGVAIAVPPDLGHVVGCKLAFASAAAVTVGVSGTASTLVSDNGKSWLRFIGKLTATMPTDLDQGVEASGTWYAVIVEWEAADASNFKATLVAASNVASPALSNNRDSFRRIGWVRNDASSDFIDFLQFGRGTWRAYMWTNASADRNVLSAGNATGSPPTAIPCATLVPPTSTLIQAAVDQAGSPTVSFFLSTTGPAVAVLAKQQVIAGIIPVDSSQRIFYSNSSAAGSVTFGVRGFYEEI